MRGLFAHTAQHSSEEALGVTAARREDGMQEKEMQKHPWSARMGSR